MWSDFDKMLTLFEGNFSKKSLVQTYVISEDITAEVRTPHKTFLHLLLLIFTRCGLCSSDDHVSQLFPFWHKPEDNWLLFVTRETSPGLMCVQENIHRQFTFPANNTNAHPECWLGKYNNIFYFHHCNKWHFVLLHEYEFHIIF